MTESSHDPRIDSHAFDLNPVKHFTKKMQSVPTAAP